eukprot:3474464-Rhodomonas_salina.2
MGDKRCCGEKTEQEQQGAWRGIKDETSVSARQQSPAFDFASGQRKERWMEQEEGERRGEGRLTVCQRL